MATTISIEFTDAQWELIKEHYPNNVVDPDSGMVSHRDITNEEFQVVIFERIKAEVAQCVRDIAVKTATQSVESCFEV